MANHLRPSRSVCAALGVLLATAIGGCVAPGLAATADAASPVPDAAARDRDAAASPVDAAARDDAFSRADAWAAPADGGHGPTPPTFPSTIDHLSFAIRTGTGANAGANGTRVSLCLNASTCFPLDVTDVDDFRRGEMDVYHFDHVALPRRDVDRVELRWGAGTDAWQPACVEVRFDGEPVHCHDDLSVTIGNDTGEQVRWSDPRGLHEGCTTCYPSRLTHGPVVGAVTPDTARVLVRTDATRPVTLQVREASGGPATIVGPRHPDPRDDYTTTFEIEGLRPRTRYVADVFVDGARVGRQASFRTAPRAGTPTAFRFAFGSCANDTHFPEQPVFARIDARDPDLFLFLGDNHYGNTGDLEAQWWHYRGTLEMPARAAFLASTSVVGTWDDHDYAGNNATRHAAGRAAALRSFHDYWANPSFGLPATPGTFFVTSYGDVDFFVTDDRYYRDTPNEAGGSILGDAQATWLEDALLRSTATFRVIASGSIFSRGGGETWLDYPDSRARLFGFLRSHHVEGVVLLGGDIHRSHVRRIHRAPYDLPELVSSGLAVTPEGTCPGPSAAEPDASQSYCSQAAPTFMELDFDTTRSDPHVVARIFDGSGTVLHTTTILRSQLR